MPKGWDIFCLILPLSMAAVLSFAMALLPVQFVFASFGFLFVVGLIIALNLHHS